VDAQKIGDFLDGHVGTLWMSRMAFLHVPVHLSCEELVDEYE
jgi:hypothetical protein